MSSIRRRALTVLLALGLALGSVSAPRDARGQQADQDEALPLDPVQRLGVIRLVAFSLYSSSDGSASCWRAAGQVRRRRLSAGSSVLRPRPASRGLVASAARWAKIPVGALL